MGRPTFRTLDDIARRGGNLWVECPQCGRHVVYPAAGVIEYFRARRWNTALEIAGEHFRCADPLGGQGCGHKGAWLAPALAKEKFLPPMPEPIEEAPPRRRR